MANFFGINLFSKEKEWRKQVVNSIDALYGGGVGPNSITLDKIQQIADKKLLGNRSGATGNVQQVDDYGKWGP